MVNLPSSLIEYSCNLHKRERAKIERDLEKTYQAVLVGMNRDFVEVLRRTGEPQSRCAGLFGDY